MPYLLILGIKTAYNMYLKIVLHIKIQFVSSDLMVVNKTHSRKEHSGLLSATLWSFDLTAGVKGWSNHDCIGSISVVHNACEAYSTV